MSRDNHTKKQYVLMMMGS